MELQEVFTTGEIAKICGVAPRTASKWIDSGLLPGWRIPGGNARRVSRAALNAFLEHYQIPALDEHQQHPAEA